MNIGRISGWHVRTVHLVEINYPRLYVVLLWTVCIDLNLFVPAREEWKIFGLRQKRAVKSMNFSFGLNYSISTERKQRFFFENELFFKKYHSFRSFRKPSNIHLRLKTISLTL